MPEPKVKDFKPEEKAEPNGTSASLRERILGMDDLPFEDVVVPEWEDITVRVRAATVEAFQDTFAGIGGDPALIVALTIACSHDVDTGERLFNSGDATVLMTKHFGAVNRLGRVASRLCGIGPEAGTRAEGNS
jgi:hypothetical protein